MANRKLPFSLPSPKATILLTNASTQYLHFISGTNRKNQFALVCESQPLLTQRTVGIPRKCAICGAPNPITGECEC
jgi:hypothetical protein